MFTPDFSPHEVTFPEGECIPEGASEILFLLFCSGALLSKVYILFCMYETVNFCFLWKESKAHLFVFQVSFTVIFI